MLSARARGWLRWLLLPPPRWVLLGVVALGAAVYLCLTASPWAAAFAVAYEVAGALLAVAQFVSLQQGLNSGWLTREVREWWQARPRTRHYQLKAEGAGARISGSAARLSVWPGASASHDEQLRLIWDKLKALDGDIERLGQDTKRQHNELEARLVQNHADALAAAEETKRGISSALTSAPLMAVAGFWLILLGLGMQVWLAVVVLP